MCGRFSLTEPERTFEEFSIVERPQLEPRYNIAPTQPVVVVRARSKEPGRRLDLLRWGLIPYWASDPKIGHRLILARAETLTTSRSFRDAAQRRRCLIPADGFFEWQHVGKAKQPFHFKRTDGKLLAMAGVWERWRSPEGEIIESCAIVTVPALSPVSAVHDRMPLIVAEDGRDLWLDESVREPAQLRPVLEAPPPELTAVPVSTRVNKPANDDAECLAAVELPDRAGEG